MLGLSKSEKRLKELEEQMLKLTRIVESHDLDWHDMRQRCKRLLDRTEKAAKRVEEGDTFEDTEVHATPGEGERSNGTPLALSPSQQRMQQQILRMRRGG